ncbi:MAG: peptidylprolyl isomerase [Betaproteobacteria bacterium]
MRTFLAGALAALMLWTPVALAQGQPGDTVLVELSGVKLLRSEYDAELLKLPSNVRAGFANSPQRVNDLLARLIVQKVLAAQAQERKLAEQPAYAARLRIEMERLLAQLRVADIEEQAGRDFDARKPQFEARARELYVVDRKKYETPERVTASHILFDLRKHTKDEGEKLARDARAKALAGADFNQLAKEVSEDPSAAMNAGRIENFARADMDAAFSSAAFSLAKPGDVSEPVLSQFGWHIIKLEEHKAAGVRSYEEVREVIIGDARKKYIDERRDAVINAIRGDPSMQVNQPAVDALVVRVDPELVKRLSDEAAKTRPAGAAPPK